MTYTFRVEDQRRRRRRNLADERVQLGRRRHSHRGGNRRYRVTAVIPLATIGEFVDGATCGLLEVEPL
jgi:hypothetical protein